jgi:hypothetical protein
MCLNGWGGRMREALVPYVKVSDPDVLCLQEVVHTPASAKSTLIYRDLGQELRQQANFFAEVSAALPDHVAIFCPSAQGDLWDGDICIPSQWGLATFVRKSIPIIGQSQGFVHGSFSANGYGEHPRSRSAHAIRVFDFDAGHPLAIAHMHGLRDLGGKHDTPERLVQAQRFLALAQSVAEPDDRMVVCGDFNVGPDSETFDVLRGGGLTDLVTTRGFTDTRTSLYEKPGRYADYLPVNDAVEVTSFDVVNSPEVSDHCPLILNLA